MRVLLLSLVSMAIAACGPAIFTGSSGLSKSTASAGGDAAGSVNQTTAEMCAANGLVPLPDSSSDDDSVSGDDDSVDGISADGVSSDDDSSDDDPAQKCQAP